MKATGPKRVHCSI